ncbi:hypothetical protein LEP1GSC040_1721 [Leptospira santarosai str. 2000030832]|nr:hypothetical protein LEP1GSC040_1721 [Leptospira santarosai str. 2000030832]
MNIDKIKGKNRRIFLPTSFLKTITRKSFNYSLKKSFEILNDPKAEFEFSIRFLTTYKLCFQPEKKYQKSRTFSRYRFVNKEKSHKLYV